ncbi:DinB family protein [Piscinibacter terrae]|uniref:Damage-inducible protein DinB n=1 Tax=Piscinibacter terrae TaxID=2496871 RepID=A0A3N7HLU2_9BURK|nr:DinB family protein [Albitalea terrae]RQP23090.1 damage-inducible protein DinB [Albitalea terrae]
MKRHLLMLARYNAWAIRRLYEHVDALSEEDYRRDAGLFFKSVHGTLNHLLVGEHLIWYVRFSDGISPRRSLDEEVETDRARLKQSLLDGAARWQPFIESLDDARLIGSLSFNSTKGVATTLPFVPTLTHVFNHGTHHRGQITAAITAMGHACPELDLLLMLREEAKP